MDKRNKQLIGFFSTIIIIFVIVFGAFWLIKSQDKFTYDGAKWEKIKYGQLYVYHTSFPLYNVTYNMYLRNDPRRNNVSIDDMNITFYKKVITAFSPEAAQCLGLGVPQTELGQFLGWAQRNVTGAFADIDYAKKMNASFADCSSAKGETTVLLFQKSETPSIKKDKNCYILSVGNCENLMTTERFLIQIAGQMQPKN